MTLTAAERAQIRERARGTSELLAHHVESTRYPGRCDVDYTSWPCIEAEVRDSAADVPALLDALEEAEAEIERADAEKLVLARECAWLSDRRWVQGNKPWGQTEWFASERAFGLIAALRDVAQRSPEMAALLS